ncbi:hypothetical protein ACOMHN_022941 [Nucella lapillus]
MVKSCTITTALLSALLLLLLLKCSPSAAMSVGSVGPLFPFFSHSNSPQNTVRCDIQSLQLLCDTCPDHLPVCSLDLEGCYWHCLSRSAAQNSHIFN